jgi:hypothetical protein
MRPTAGVLPTWAARIGGWSVVLASLAYVVWNHQGIGLRGHMVRLTLTSERERAKAALLQHAGLNAPPEQFDAYPLSNTYVLSGPESVLRRRPSVLHLARLTSVDGPPRHLRVCFDSDGQLAGAPVDLTSFSSLLYHGASEPMLELGALRLLVATEVIRAPSPAPTSAPLLQALVLHVFRLGFPAAVEVLAARCEAGPRQIPVFAVNRDSAGNAALDLVLKTYTTATAAADVQILAGFTWDEVRGGFVGPPPDPQGQWEVIYPPPKAVGDSR